MNYKSLAVLIFVLFFVSYNKTYCQKASPYYNNTTYQRYLNYLIYSGRIKINHPLSQPFNVEQLSDTITRQSRVLLDPDTQDPETQTAKPIEYLKSHSWLSLLKKDLDKRYISMPHKDSIRGNVILGMDVGNKNYYNNNINANFFFGAGNISYTYRNFGMYSNVRLDEGFRNDTLYFGTTGKLENRVISRSDETYAQWEGRNINLFAGRLSRNFGMPGEASLILSNEAFSFDQLVFTFRNKAFKYTYLFSRLNDIYGYDIRDSLPKFQWSKRFLSLHRFDISLSNKLEIAFTDVILFGGKDAFPQFQYLNPTNFLFMSKMSDRKGYEEGTANALMCFDIYYKPSNSLTLFGQFLIDDMDFTKSLRALYPDRIGYSGKVVYCDLFPASQFYLSYNRISNWTYTSFYNWGNYTYYGKSMGYPLNGVENLKLGFDEFKFFPFMFGFEFKAEQYRRQDLNATFIALKSDFPIGIPQRSMSYKINTNFAPNTFISASLSTEFISYNNYAFVKAQKQSYINILLTLKIQGILNVF
jgi:hypothetical protein